MNSLLDIQVFAPKHFWDGSITQKLEKVGVVFMENKSQEYLMVQKDNLKKVFLLMETK